MHRTSTTAVLGCLVTLSLWSVVPRANLVLAPERPEETAGAAQDLDGDWELERPAPVIPLRPPVLAKAKDLTCRECHTEVVDQWAATAHGIAWVDEVYRDAIADRRRPGLCHACHVPAPVLAKGRPLSQVRPRTQGDQPFHFGVSCDACHLGPEGVYLGPTGAPTEAHATAASEWLRGPGTNELCSTCHSTNIGPVLGIAKDFAESGQAERGRSCVGCHMNAEPTGLDGAPRRTHLLQTPRDPAFLRRAFVLTYEPEQDRIEIENRAGHRVPGLIGRQITFQAVALGDSGEVLAKNELVINALTYLPVDGRVYLSLDAVGDSVTIVGLHEDPRQEEPIEFLREELDVLR